MPRFEYEITKRIEIVTTITVAAKDEDAADELVQKKIADGLTDKITWVEPPGWTTETDETDYQLR